MAVRRWMAGALAVTGSVASIVAVFVPPWAIDPTDGTWLDGLDGCADHLPPTKGADGMLALVAAAAALVAGVLLILQRRRSFGVWAVVAGLLIVTIGGLFAARADEVVSWGCSFYPSIPRADQGSGSLWLLAAGLVVLAGGVLALLPGDRSAAGSGGVLAAACSAVTAFCLLVSIGLMSNAEYGGTAILPDQDSGFLIRTVTMRWIGLASGVLAAALWWATARRSSAVGRRRTVCVIGAIASVAVGLFTVWLLRGQPFDPYPD